MATATATMTLDPATSNEPKKDDDNVVTLVQLSGSNDNCNQSPPSDDDANEETVTTRPKRSTRPFANSSSAVVKGSKSDITNKTVAEFWAKTEHSNVNKQRKNKEHKKTVTICEEKNVTFEWENPEEDRLNEIWYTQRELDQIQKDNRKKLQLKHFDSRGLEDLLNKEEEAAQKKRREYVREVIKVYKETKARSNNHNNNNQDDSKKENHKAEKDNNIDPAVVDMMVSHVAFTNSQACQKKAYKRAKEDETDAYHIYKKDHKKTNSGDGPKFRRTATMPERAEYFVKRLKKKDLASKMATAGSNFLNAAAKAAAG